MKCENCEYEPYCFWLLRKTNTLFPDSCRQGRRKREYKAKPVTLKEVINAQTNSGTPVSPV